MILIPYASSDDARGRVWDDILEMARCSPDLAPRDTSLISDSIFDGYYVAVDYDVDPQDASLAPSQSFLATLAQDPAYFVIWGVGPDTVPVYSARVSFPEENYTVYQTGGGVTDWPLPVGPETVTQLWYDVSDTYTYLDVNNTGQTILCPRCVILYHELGHAYWDSREGANLADEDSNEAQLQAITEENAFRAELHLQARSTDPLARMPGGQNSGTPEVPPLKFSRCTSASSVGYWQYILGCAIATAAAGSPHAPVVQRLRRARTHYLSLSSWTGLLAGQAQALYRQFSPLVVRDMAADPALATAVLLYAVLPVAQFIEIIEQYIADTGNNPELLACLDEHISAYVADLVNANVSAASLRVAAEAAASAGRHLTRNPDSEPVRASQRRMPDDLFSYLASMIASTRADTTSYTWGFNGLALFLRKASARLADGATLDERFLAELDSWLAHLPIPADAELIVSDASDELTVLSKRFLTAAAARELFAAQLLALWPADSTPALKILLSSLDYIKASSD